MIVDPFITAYAKSMSIEEPELFQELARETRERRPDFNMQSGHVEGTLLRLLIQMIGAKRVLEIGTFTGYSALAMAQGLPEEGELFTCDTDGEATAIAKRYWARSPHGKKITLCMGPALDTIARLEGPFDFVFIDADKKNYSNYWEACVPKVRPGGLLAADNVLWDGRVLNPKEPNDHAIAAFNELVRGDARVEQLMLTIRDGVTIARRL